MRTPVPIVVAVVLVLGVVVVAGLPKHHSSRPGHHHPAESERGNCHEVAIEFEQASQVEPFAARWSREQFDREPQLRALRPIHRHVPNVWLFENVGTLDPDTLSVHLQAEQRRTDAGRLGVRHFECQHARARGHRVAIDEIDPQRLVASLRSEPLWARQWHLHDGTEVADYWLHSGAAADQLSVLTTWRTQRVFGRGVVISVVDDGLDHMHREFRDSYRAAFSWDYNANDANPAPFVHDSHGTEAAALASGRLNGACGLGVAPLSELAAVRLVAEPISDAVEAHGLTHADSSVDVYSCSWGPIDDGQRLDGPGPVTLAAMHAAAEREGRNGLGVVYVWAAGNGRVWLDSCNYDGFANSRIVLPVGAVDFFGRDTPYSEWCASAAVSAPSSGSRGPLETHRISTAQPHGYFGESSGECSDSFGGTSAAAPLIAGAVALVLEARPQLHWRQVQRVLFDTATRNDPSHPSWVQNGAGRWHSPAYGFGVVNTTAAVLRARAIDYDLDAEHERYRAERVVAPPDQFPLAIHEGFPFQDTLITLDVSASELRVEFVEIVFTAEHPRRGELEVFLRSPAGTLAVLAQAHLDSGANYDSWVFGARTFLDESATGQWVLSVRDAIPSAYQGSVLGVQLNIWGV